MNVLKKGLFFVLDVYESSVKAMLVGRQIQPHVVRILCVLKAVTLLDESNTPL